MHAGDLESGRDAGGDECGGNEILCNGGIKIEGSTGDGKRRRNDRSDHGESMLETEKEG